MILAIDQGTTGTTAILLNRDLQVQGRASFEFPQIYPQPGWVEHNPEAIWDSVRKAVLGALEATGIDGREIRSIGITNQRETTVVWEREGGAAIANAIVWQCRRTTERCNTLKAQGHEFLIREKTGLVLDPYFSGTKLAWILDNTSGARERARRGELAAGTIDSFLVWRLTAGAAHVTDFSNASRTMLMDLANAQWDDDLIRILDVERSTLPEIRGNAEVYGTTRGLDFLPDGIPIAGMAGDQQAALFGQACFEAGEAKCTYGTGAFLLMNTGARTTRSTNGMLTTGAWQLDGKRTYALEGSAFIAGAVVQWLRDELGFVKSAREIEELAASVPDTGGVVLVPALTGLGAPYWNPEARGVLWGLTRGTGRGHIARAALEGIAFQCRDILEAMERDLGAPLGVLRVDGGAAANNLLMQFQSDILAVEVSRPAMLETTALGAAMLAGLGVGLFSDMEALRNTWQEERRFQPTMDAAGRQDALARWHRGLQRI